MTQFCGVSDNRDELIFSRRGFSKTKEHEYALANGDEKMHML